MGETIEQGIPTQDEIRQTWQIWRDEYVRLLAEESQSVDVAAQRLAQLVVAEFRAQVWVNALVSPDRPDQKPEWAWHSAVRYAVKAMTDSTQHGALLNRAVQEIRRNEARTWLREHRHHIDGSILLESL